MKTTYNSDDERIIAAIRKFSNILKKDEFGHHGKSRMLNVIEAEGPISQRALQEHVEISSSSASEILGKMEDHGLIKRSVNPDDTRTRIVEITESGKERAAQLNAEKGRKAKEYLSGLTEDEKAVMAKLFDKIQDDWYERGLFYGDCKDHRRKYHE